MKKLILASVTVVALCASLQSCKKYEEQEGKTTYQIIDIVLDANKSYQYSFGTLDTKSTITKQSQAFLVSELDKVNNAVLFNYTPQTNFIGTDEVQVTIGEDEKEHHGKKGGPHPKNPLNMFKHKNHHGCDKDDDDYKTVYTFKFTINRNEVTKVPVVVTESQK
jgi:hypothetical protein